MGHLGRPVRNNDQKQGGVGAPGRPAHAMPTRTRSRWPPPLATTQRSQHRNPLDGHGSAYRGEEHRPRGRLTFCLSSPARRNIAVDREFT